MVRAWTLSGLGYSKGGTVRDGGHWLTALIRSRRCCRLTGTRRREKMKDGRGWFGQGPPLTGWSAHGLVRPLPGRDRELRASRGLRTRKARR